MTGTLINIGAILAGSLVGILLGSKLPEKLRQTVLYAMGFFIMALGFQMFLKTSNSLIVLGSILIGVILGEWWHIEEWVEKFGVWIETKILGKNKVEGQSQFVQGFLTTSLLYCVGPMAILGAIQDGMTGDYSILAVKATLDGFSAVAFTSALGIGVPFSSIPLLFYQGGISLVAGWLQPFVTNAMMAEMTATGGILLIGLAFSSILKIRRVRVGNFLPALIIAPVLVGLLTRLGWL